MVRKKNIIANKKKVNFFLMKFVFFLCDLVFTNQGDSGQNEEVESSMDDSNIQDEIDESRSDIGADDNPSPLISFNDETGGDNVQNETNVNETTVGNAHAISLTGFGFENDHGLVPINGDVVQDATNNNHSALITFDSDNIYDQVNEIGGEQSQSNQMHLAVDNNCVNEYGEAIHGNHVEDKKGFLFIPTTQAQGQAQDIIEISSEDDSPKKVIKQEVNESLVHEISVLRKENENLRLHCRVLQERVLNRSGLYGFQPSASSTIQTAHGYDADEEKENSDTF